MKKILIALLVLIIFAIAGVAVFIATFDINKYNRALASQIESVVGSPVEIGRLSLGWKGRLLLGVEEFQILTADAGKNIPELSFDRGDMAIELMPLLKAEIKISSISVVRPRMHLVKARDGKIALRGYNPKAAQSPTAAKFAALPAAVNFSINSIVVKDGMLRFEDFSQAPPADISIDSIDANIKNVSLSTQVEFIIKMAVFSSRQNANISGYAGGFVAAPLYVKDLNAEIDLRQIDNAKLMKALPSLGKNGIAGGLAGLLRAKITDLQFADNKVTRLLSDITFTDGRVSLAQVKVPIEHIGLSASIVDDRVSVKSFSATLANASLKGIGDISNIYVTPETKARFDIKVPALKQFLSSIAGGRQYLDGKAAFSFDGTMAGSSWDSISKTLTGAGTFSLDNGKLLDTNIIRQSLGTLELFPGLVDSLGYFLPVSIREVLNRDYTILKPVRQSFTIRDGVASLPDLKIGTDYADMQGAASLTLQGELVGNGIIRFAPELSAAMIKAVPQMDYLADQQGIIGFHINFRASGAGVAITPDVQFIVQRAAMKKGQEMVIDLIRKATGPKDAAQQGSAYPQEPQSSSINDIMKRMKAFADMSQ